MHLCLGSLRLLVSQLLRIFGSNRFKLPIRRPRNKIGEMVIARSVVAYCFM
ncbi:hypothetical protein HanXRQr2_Chr02g0083131 [Helianthus annuus]|uniref:Uncharacterized protein n=1 Tax=Helianthus annuus TaxID=4232 RepID=A0A9K3JSR3_HELAN|nr:hypothetical protein HanXRQr2_Chr02g0083131 [Helianthus annuus]